MFKKILVSSLLTLSFLFVCLPINALAINYNLGNTLINSYSYNVYLPSDTTSAAQSFYADYKKNQSSYMTIVADAIGDDNHFKTANMLFYICKASVPMATVKTNVYAGFSILGNGLTVTANSIMDSNDNTINRKGTLTLGVINTTFVAAFGVINNSSSSFNSHCSELRTSKINLNLYFEPPVTTALPITTPRPPQTTVTIDTKYVPWNTDKMLVYDEHIKGAVQVSVNVGFAIFAMIIAIYIMIRIVKKFNKTGY